MAELLSPGVFIEEVPSQVQIVGPVSTSTMAIVGFTKKGPTDTATLVTSFDQFTQTFGSIAKESFLGLSVAAFFANGGKRAYIVRVVPADAVAASCKVQSQTTNQVIGTGDGATTAFVKTAGTTTLKVNSGASPIVAETLTLKWREVGTPVVGEALKKRDGSAALVAVTGQQHYEGRIDPAGLQASTEGLDLVVRGTVTVKYTLTVGGAKSIAIPVGSGPVATGTGAAGSATLDVRTGRLSLSLAAATLVADNGNAFTADYTPTTATKVSTDDGAGNLGGDAAAASVIDYDTGAYTLNTTTAVADGSSILASYKINAWSLAPVSKGKWGNDLKVQISGHPDHYSASTASYSKFNVSVLLKNDLGSYDTVESYEELDLADSTSDMFFPDVLNELSDYVVVTDPGGNEAPGELAGVARSMAIAGGDASTAGQTITSAATNSNVVLGNGPISPRSVSITWTNAAGLTKTVTDDGDGNLIGDVDSAYVASVTVGGVTLTGNQIDYTTGTFAFKTSAAIKGATVVVATYESKVAETTHSEVFGDTTKGYTVGEDGTFDSTNFSRSQFTDSTLLSSSYKGLYALDRIDDILQVIVPDFAGDATVTGDLLDYAASRATQPCGGDRFIILTVPKGSSAQKAVDWFRYTLGRYSDFAAIYWPWVKVSDPNANNRPLVMPPLGHLAGIYARTDSTKNVGKSPGGTVDGALTFLTGLEMNPTLGERDLVYPNRINPLISSPQTGLAVWGVRTISNNPDWKYINARRLFMFLEKSIYNSTFWVVFENNSAGLWTRVKTQVSGFMQNLYNNNYFAGNTPAQAYLVTVDSTNNSDATVNAGQLIVDVAAAPNKPAEFVRVRFTQKTLN